MTGVLLSSSFSRAEAHAACGPSTSRVALGTAQFRRAGPEAEQHSGSRNSLSPEEPVRPKPSAVPGEAPDFQRVRPKRRPRSHGQDQALHRERRKPPLGPQMQPQEPWSTGSRGRGPGETLTLQPWAPCFRTRCSRVLE
ncbi:hypothetical protein HJG60_009219 [Phyllostomus discolor]|uniref:Uncharacterized protein n=1 Tax=Phyllostomus discolor TaxID=89673 RepID=A0A833YMD3_9CHIR|nr:hypothetical protein HJG60_009219 [Phyllostomus discolor]